MERHDIAVIGGGLAGMTAALVLARSGRRIAHVAPKAGPDRRTTALMDHSIRLFERLGLWDKLEPQAAALSAMQIIDGTGRLFRAPTVMFRSAEIDLAAFGYNFPNAALGAVLAEALRAEPNVTPIAAAVEAVTHGADAVTVAAGGNIFDVDLVVGADGRRSPTREGAGIGVKRWSYPQAALVLNFAHRLPHRQVSTEFHTEWGPFTQVPLPGNRSSLVWVMTPAEAERFAAMQATELASRVEARMQSMLGAVTVEDGVQVWPLSGMTADRFGKGRTVLVGEAAHAFPPIGAQGLNLSLRDVIAVETLVSEAAGRPLDAGAGERFDRRRRADIVARSASVDLLNRSLLSGLLPVQMARAAGLHLLSAVAPLRQMVMREGVEPGRGFAAALPGLGRRTG